MQLIEKIMDMGFPTDSLGSGVLTPTRHDRASFDHRPVGGVAKRVMDISMALPALLVLAPIMVIVALLIWRHDRKAPIFGHTRIGHRGQAFKCLKFRSMVADSAEVLTRHLATNVDAAREWAETQKLRNDPRITPIGRLLRLSSLDELPQLLNVLRGDMSIVGPRPIVLAEVARYGNDIDSYSACRPGLTGLWQISGRSDTSYNQRVGLDVSYVRNYSIYRDFLVVLKTIPVVVQQKGSC